MIGVLNAYCFDSEEDSTLLDLQSICGIDGLETSQQISDSIKNFDTSKLKDIENLFKENKVIKKFEDFSVIKNKLK